MDVNERLEVPTGQLAVGSAGPGPGDDCRGSLLGNAGLAEVLTGSPRRAPVLVSNSRVPRMCIRS